MSLPPRILYVDDDLADCEMMAFWLREECGYDVSAAVDGKHALELIETEFFDLFILDYCLPDLTAVTLCERIRAIDPEAPILVYSALDREIDKQKAFSAGANHYLIKPDQFSELRKSIDNLMGREAYVPPSAAPEFRPAFHVVMPKRSRAAGIV